MTRAPSSVKNAAAMLLPAPIPPVSQMIGATIAAVAIPTRTASRGSPRPHAIGARATLPPMKLASRRRRAALPGGGAESAVVALPPGFPGPGPTAVGILAHGAGSTRTNPVLSAHHAGLARACLAAGPAPPPPRPATARHAPHHRVRRSLLPRPAPRGTHRRRRLGRDLRRRGALAAGPRRVGSAAPPRAGEGRGLRSRSSVHARLVGCSVPPVGRRRARDLR